MYSIQTEFHFEAAHNLYLNYESPCKNIHGHSYKCVVTISSDRLNENKMVCDFKILKQIIKEKVEDVLDHKYLNDIFDVNSTAEHMSEWIYTVMNIGLKERNINARCVKVELNETEKNKAIYEE